MNRLFKSQFNLNIGLPDDIDWLIYQFLRKSNAQEIAFAIEQSVIKSVLLTSKISICIIQDIMNTKPRLKEVIRCAFMIYNFAFYKIHTPNNLLVSVWAQIKLGPLVNVRRNFTNMMYDVPQ
jgi:hypothetical protein